MNLYHAAIFPASVLSGLIQEKRADHPRLVNANCRCNAILVSRDGFTKAAAGSRSLPERGARVTVQTSGTSRMFVNDNDH